jgi:hypothetical protein
MGSQRRHSTHPPSTSASVPDKGIRSKEHQPPTDRNRRNPSQAVAELTELAASLRFISGTALAVEKALRHQNAEHDVDLADCLRSGVVDPASLQMERAESLVKRLGGRLPRATPGDV